MMEQPSPDMGALRRSVEYDGSASAADELAEAWKTIDNLEAALRTSRHIGMAVGILMIRHGLTEEAAFQVLRRVSQQRHRKIRDLVEDVIYTGDLELPT